MDIAAPIALDARWWRSAVKRLRAPYLRAILVCSILANGLSAPAQVASAPLTSVASLELSGQLDLARLVDLAATQLKLQIDYDAALLRQQSMTLRPTGPLDDRTLWLMTNRALLQRGFTTVATPEFPGLSVVKVEDAARTARLEEPSSIEAARGTALGQPGFRNAVFILNHISSREAAEIVRAALSRGGDGKTTAGPGTVAPLGNDQRLLLVSETSARIDEAIGVLRRIDISDRAMTTVEMPVENLTPAQVAATVAQLVTKRESVGSERLPGEIMASSSNRSVLVIAPAKSLPVWEAMVRQADRRETVEIVAYTPRVFAVRDVASLIQQIAVGVGGNGSVDDRLRIVVEEPTGTILVTATSAQHGRIRELMDRLDAVPGEARRPMRAFAVRNRSVTELMDVLQRMIAAGALMAESDRSTGRGPSDTTTGLSPVALPNPGGQSATPTANAIAPAPAGGFLSSTPSQPGSRPSRGTDLPLTLTADEATNTIIAVGEARLLAQLETLLKTLDVRQPQVMLEVVLVTLSERDSLSLGVEVQQLIRDGNTAIALSSLFGLSTVTGAGATQALSPSTAAGFTGAVIRPGDFSVVVKALQSLGSGRAVSLPKVLVANNQKAQFDSLVQEPYGVSFTQGNSNATNVTFGGTLDAGVKLAIKPQISEGDTLLLDYSISISSFGEQGRAGNLPPSRQVNGLQSLATVPDGHTVVVGGLETANDSTSTDQIPLLGDIPLLGEAFKNRSQSKSRSRFYVLIRPIVMRGQSLEALRGLSAPAIEQAGLPPDWPTTKVQIIK